MEYFAIIEVIEEWRPECKGVLLHLQVLSDYKN